MRKADVPVPTDEQVNVTISVTRWYLERYHDTDQDVGVARMFTDPARVGAFAVAPAALRAGDPAALFRALVATVMFQRRQDLQIMRVLKGISARDAEELTSPARLMELAHESGCPHASDLRGLVERCDLFKDAARRGACRAQPSIPCAPKRHTEVLKRYGHFGKVPTGLALALREAGARDLGELRLWALRRGEDPAQAAALLEGALTAAWRVSDKIAAMYLSMLSNPDLCPGTAPWADGLDWRRWVVIDSNVDLFLRSIAYAGPGTYEARATFLRRLASQVRLSTLKRGLSDFNPRLVQQAAYLFMSKTNRRASPRDCLHEPGACVACPAPLRSACGLAAAPHIGEAVGPPRPARPRSSARVVPRG